MKTETPITKELDALGIPYRLHLHPQPLRSLAQAARERGLRPEQIVRSLLFRLEGERYILVMMPGDRQVDWKKLRRFLGVSRITTADREEVQRVTGYPPGAVSPIGLPSSIRILADRRIQDEDTLSMGAGIPNAGLILSRADLLKAVKPEFGDFC